MRVVQAIGVPQRGVADDVDAVVVALKTRTIAAAEAVKEALAALHWLRSRGAAQIYFKYCSTFDSTPAGNIGPVTEALMDALRDLPGADFTIATPAFPDNGRTVFNGHLFVGDTLLHESGMQHHPLTPMTDSNLVRVLQAQCRRKVGLVDYRVVARGDRAIRARFDALRRDGVGIAIVDAISNDDLFRLGPALAGVPLVTAGSGVAIALPSNFGIEPSAAASELPHAAQIAKHFGTVRAVDDVSIDIRRGEFFSLLGPSGCGKTTLLRMLAGFEFPTTGEIFIDGQPMSSVPPNERPTNMVFQS